MINMLAQKVFKLKRYFKCYVMLNLNKIIQLHKFHYDQKLRIAINYLCKHVFDVRLWCVMSNHFFKI